MTTWNLFLVVLALVLFLLAGFLPVAYDNYRLRIVSMGLFCVTLATVKLL